MTRKPKQKRTPKLPRRNPLVPVTRRLGHGVKPSGKIYRRKTKHSRPSADQKEPG